MMVAILTNLLGINDLPYIHQTSSAYWFKLCGAIIVLIALSLWVVMGVRASNPQIPFQARVNYQIQEGESVHLRILAAARQAKSGAPDLNEFSVTLNKAMSRTRQYVEELQGSQWQEYFKAGHPSGLNNFMVGDYAEVLKWVNTHIERLKYILSKI